MRRAGLVAAALIVILAVGWIDYLTGPDIGMSLLYLAPVAVVAWFGGAAADAIVCALVASVCWFAADVPFHDVKISLWNGFTRTVLFGTVAFLLHKVRTDRATLMAVNRDLHDALRRESSLARTDQVTGLPNSRAFIEALNRETARASRERSTLCVVYIDIDLFKLVNDVYGHEAGDSVLRRTAEAISSSVRDGDVVARIGGDEFAVLLWHVSRDEATHVVERIERHFEVIARDFPLAYLGISAGVSYFDEPPADPEDAVREADRAMYRAKQARRQTGT